MNLSVRSAQCTYCIAHSYPGILDCSHPPYQLILLRVVGGCSLSQHALGERQGTLLERLPVYHRANTYRQTNTFTLTCTPTGNLEFLSPDLHVFGLWKGTRAPAEKTCRHAENIQTPWLTPKQKQ